MAGQFIHYSTRKSLFESLASQVAAELKTALKTNSCATLAVPGGTTPQPFFEHLRKTPLKWEAVKVMLTDERFLPETSDRSNTRLVRETLLQDCAKTAQFVPFYHAAQTPEEVLNTISDAISDALPLDVCVLGMGTDMHTASLFPGADNIARALSDNAPVVLPMRAPNAPEPRLTLTAPVLKAAKSIHILIVGPDKHLAYETALRAGSDILAPVRVILDQATIHYAD